jgi:heterodisulfide reductase subunit D
MREEIVKLGKGPEAMSELARVVAEEKNTFGMSIEKKNILGQKYNLPSKGDVLFFSGCYSVFRNLKEADDTIKILKNTGENIAYLGDKEWCCGVMQYWDGNTSVMRDLVFHNLEMFDKSGVNKIVTACSGCYDTIKDIYPEIIEDELPFEVVHLSEYLADLIDDGKLNLKNELNKTVTYHDPCHLGRHAGVYEPPRKVIKAIPGVEFVEMERNRNAAFCCGSGIGSVRATHPELALDITHSRVNEALATGAQVVTSACPMCVEQLELSGKKRNLNLEFINLPELVAKALGV